MNLQGDVVYGTQLFLGRSKYLADSVDSEVRFLNQPLQTLSLWLSIWLSISL